MQLLVFLESMGQLDLIKDNKVKESAHHEGARLANL
jgi:hypothetical protein